jgi:hypothetical protein
MIADLGKGRSAGTPAAEMTGALAVTGARLLLQGPLRVCATMRAILLPKMTLATHGPH